MNAIYTVGPHPCPPDWGIMMYLLRKDIKEQPMLKTCRYQPCGVEFESYQRAWTKEYCCEEHARKGENEKRRARRTTRTIKQKGARK